MTVQYAPPQSGILILNWTTQQQLELIKKELSQRYNEVHLLVQDAWEHADCTDQIDNDLDGLWNALQNICSDLEIPGFEMS